MRADVLLHIKNGLNHTGQSVRLIMHDSTSQDIGPLQLGQKVSLGLIGEPFTFTVVGALTCFLKEGGLLLGKGTVYSLEGEFEVDVLALDTMLAILKAQGFRPKV